MYTQWVALGAGQQKSSRSIKNKHFPQWQLQLQLSTAIAPIWLLANTDNLLDDFSELGSRSRSRSRIRIRSRRAQGGGQEAEEDSEEDEELKNGKCQICYISDVPKVSTVHL